MSAPPRPLVAIALLLALAPSTARAQDLDEVEAQPAAVNNGFELHESNFDNWVYGNAGRGLSGRDQLESLLTLNVGEIERSCRLSEAQKRKLLLAGRGDIKRFSDRVAEAKKVFERLRHDQNNINEIFQATQPLSATLRVGLFGRDSFFHKTLGATLEPDQASLYRESVREKDRFRYRAKVRLAITNLDNAVGLTADQRQKLLDLALAETTPPDASAGQYEPTVVLLKLSRIPEARYRSILDDARWKAMEQQFQQARGMEQFLKSNGFLEDAEPAGGKN